MLSIYNLSKKNRIGTAYPDAADSTYHIDRHAVQPLVQEWKDPLGLLVNFGAGRRHQVLGEVPLDRPRVSGWSKVGALDVTFLSAPHRSAMFKRILSTSWWWTLSTMFFGLE